MLDADRRWDAIDPVHIRSGHGCDKLSCVGIHGIQKSALSFTEQKIEGQSAFPGTTDARDDDQLIPWDDNIQILQVVLPGSLNDNVVGISG